MIPGTHPWAAAAAAVLLTVGGLAVTAAASAVWRRRQALGLRVDLLIEQPVQPARRSRPVLSASLARADVWLLRVFALGRAGADDADIGGGALLAIGVAAGAATWLLCRLALHWRLSAAALPALLALVFVPRRIAQWRLGRFRGQFLEAFPDTVDTIVRMIRAGLPVTVAIRAVAEQGAEPIRRVFSRIASEADIGIALEDALAAAAIRLGLPDFRFFALAVALQRATGGNLAVSLETLGEIIRKRRAVRLKAKAATAEVRISAYVLGGIPVFLAGALKLISPTYLDTLLTTRAGNYIAGAAILCLMAAGITMRWLMRRALA